MWMDSLELVPIWKSFRYVLMLSRVHSMEGALKWLGWCHKLDFVICHLVLVQWVQIVGIIGPETVNRLPITMFELTAVTLTCLYFKQWRSRMSHQCHLPRRLLRRPISHLVACCLFCILVSDMFFFFCQKRHVFSLLIQYLSATQWSSNNTWNTWFQEL